MSLIPDWPPAPGPRVLMMVANDLTIDARVRKAASSVARAGFSVIAVGLDVKGASPPSETLDGALLVRVNPGTDPRISPHLMRWSRPELTDALRSMIETRRNRLLVSRRTLTAEVAHSIANPPSWTHVSGRLSASAARLIGAREEIAEKVGRRITRYARRLSRTVLHSPRKIATIYRQIVLQASRAALRILSRPSRPLLRRASWRRDLPELHRYEAVIGPLIDSLEPDLIHVHDVFLLGVAARAKSRANSAGNPGRLIYDAHEYVPGLPTDARRKLAYTSLEDEFARRADGFVTVSNGLADLLERRFSRRPFVVLNAPDMERLAQVESVRNVLGLTGDSPLVIYVGGVAPHRGAEILIDAMRMLDESVHLAFITNSTTGYVADLARTGSETGLADRLHFVPYVAPEAVVSYIRDATVSAVPLSRAFVNYEIALPNKLFQSIHAGVPVVVSDNPEMSRFVLEHHIGEVFVDNDSNSLVTALSKVIENREAYSSGLSDPGLLRSISWDAQVETLLQAYRTVGVEVS